MTKLGIAAPCNNRLATVAARTISPFMSAKSELPVKICVQCGKPMVWRKKWEKNWEEVKFCSQRCRREAKSGVPPRQAIVPMEDR